MLIQGRHFNNTRITKQMGLMLPDLNWRVPHDRTPDLCSRIVHFQWIPLFYPNFAKFNLVVTEEQMVTPNLERDRDRLSVVLILLHKGNYPNLLFTHLYPYNQVRGRAKGPCYGIMVRRLSRSTSRLQAAWGRCERDILWLTRHRLQSFRNCKIRFKRFSGEDFIV